MLSHPTEATGARRAAASQRRCPLPPGYCVDMARSGLALSLLAIALGGSAASATAAAPPELITVSDTDMEATWGTDAASDTTVCAGVDRANLRCERQEEGLTLHHARLGGLLAGRRYVYELRSGGVVQPSSEANPGSFTTLRPPPGRHLLDIGLVSDVHVGESCSGTAVTAPLIDQSIPECFTAPDYAARMLEGAVDELNSRGVDVVIDSADITSTAKFEEETRARTILGGLHAPFFVVRGNHDRPGQHANETRCGAEKDCLRTVFFPDRAPGRVYYSVTVSGVHVVFLDSSDANGEGDLTDAAQNEFLRSDLAAHRRQRTFIVFHHPVSEYADVYALPPVVFGVRPDRGGAAFLTLVAQNPQVSGVLNAHTHRNFVSTALASGPRTVFLENAATKEYPGGYSVLRVYEGGWMRNFRRTGCAFCRQWTETTRAEYNGLYPSYTLGSLSTRNFVHLDDCGEATPPQSLPLQQGGDTAPRPARCGESIGYPAGPGSGAPSGSATGASSVGPCRTGARPRTSITRRSSRLTRSGLLLRGRAHSRGCAVVRRVLIAVARRVGRGCRHLGVRGGLGGARPCRQVVWIRARGTARWSFRRHVRLRPGTYLVRARARDARGAVERRRAPYILRLRGGESPVR